MLPGYRVVCAFGAVLFLPDDFPARFKGLCNTAQTGRLLRGQYRLSAGQNQNQRTIQKVNLSQQISQF
jgi:hypothetical protein